MVKKKPNRIPSPIPIAPIIKQGHYRQFGSGIGELGQMIKMPVADYYRNIDLSFNAPVFDKFGRMETGFV